jgi:hypothetical protein
MAMRRRKTTSLPASNQPKSKDSLPETKTFSTLKFSRTNTMKPQAMRKRAHLHSQRQSWSSLTILKKRESHVNLPPIWRAYIDSKTLQNTSMGPSPHKEEGLWEATLPTSLIVIKAFIKSRWKLQISRISSTINSFLILLRKNRRQQPHTRKVRLK